MYYGVFLSAPNIGGNFYLNFFLTSLIELPAIPAGVWAFNRFVEHRVHMKWTCFIKLLPILTLSLVAIGQEKCETSFVFVMVNGKLLTTRFSGELCQLLLTPL